MQLQEFKGAKRLIEHVNEAVQCGNQEELAERVKQSLCTLIRSGELAMPACVHEPAGDHYARRLLYRSDEHGYSMVAMTWGPGQGTPVHDHSGLWCVEAVCHGTIKVIQFEPAEQRGDEYRFSQEESIRASVGTAGCLIPPHEYHTIRNVSDTECAVTLHIYGGEMECCNVFEETGDGWYRKVRKNLAYDAA